MFVDHDYIDNYRRSVRARLLSFSQAHYLPSDVETTVDVRRLYESAEPRIFKSNAPRVLIVMRSYFNAAATAIMMKRFGCNVVICRTGREAYSRYLRHGSKNFHICIVQWNLDDVSGRDLVYYEREKGGDLVFLAAVPEKMPADLVVRSGADLFLRMPLCIHMHVLRGLLLPNLQSSYAFPVKVMKMRPNHQQVQQLLNSVATHTQMDKDTEDALREANQLLNSTQDAVLDANMKQFEDVLVKLKKVVHGAKEHQEGNLLKALSSQNVFGETGSSSSGFGGGRSKPKTGFVHPLRAAKSSGMSSSSGGADFDKITEENARLSNAFQAALRTFNEMKTEITQLLHQRQKTQRLLLHNKPELSEIVAPFDPGATIDTMSHPDLCRVVSQLRHHVANLLVENEQLTEDYERLCHFRVEMEEVLHSAGIAVSFTDVQNVTVAMQDHQASYAEHAIKLLMSNETMTEEEREDLRRLTTQNVVHHFRRKSRVPGAGGGDPKGLQRAQSGNNSAFDNFSFGGVGGGQGGGSFVANRRRSLVSPPQRESSGIPSIVREVSSTGNTDNDDDGDGDDGEGMGAPSTSIYANAAAKRAAHQHARALHAAHANYSLASKSLQAYERMMMQQNDKWTAVKGSKVPVPDRIPIHLDPIGNSTAPHDLFFDNTVRFVHSVLSAGHAFVERAVTITPSLFMRGEEFLRQLNVAYKELEPRERHKDVDVFMRDRNIRERQSLTDGFNNLKTLREQLAAARAAPERDQNLVRKAEQLRKQAARYLARQLKAHVIWSNFRKWMVWSKNRKIHKMQHSHVLELQALQATTGRESQALRQQLEEETRQSHKAKLDLLRAQAHLEDSQKAIEKMRAQDTLKDRTIARLNEKLLVAAAAAAKEDKSELLHFLTAHKEMVDVGLQTDIVVDDVIAIAKEKAREAAEGRRVRNPSSAVQCELLSDQTLEDTVDYAIRSFIQATKNMNMPWAGGGGGAQQQQTTASALLEHAKQEQQKKKQESSGISSGGSPSSSPAAPALASSSPSATTAAAAASPRSKAMQRWNMLLNPSMLALMKTITKDAITTMAPVTAAKLEQKQHRHDEEERSKARGAGRSSSTTKRGATGGKRPKNKKDYHRQQQQQQHHDGDDDDGDRHQQQDSSTSWSRSGTPPSRPSGVASSESSDLDYHHHHRGVNVENRATSPLHIETVDAGILTDDHGLADAIAPPDVIQAAHSRISRKKMQQQKEASRFPTVGEAARSVNELQRFSKSMRDAFDVDLHFYFEVANPTMLEVVREIVRGAQEARAQVAKSLKENSPRSRQQQHHGLRDDEEHRFFAASGDYNNNNDNGGGVGGGARTGQSISPHRREQRRIEQAQRALPGVHFDTTTTTAAATAAGDPAVQQHSSAGNSPIGLFASAPGGAAPAAESSAASAPPPSMHHHRRQHQHQNLDRRSRQQHPPAHPGDGVLRNIISSPVSGSAVAPTNSNRNSPEQERHQSAHSSYEAAAGSPTTVFSYKPRSNIPAHLQRQIAQGTEPHFSDEQREANNNEADVSSLPHYAQPVHHQQQHHHHHHHHRQRQVATTSSISPPSYWQEVQKRQEQQQQQQQRPEIEEQQDTTVPSLPPISSPTHKPQAPRISPQRQFRWQGGGDQQQQQQQQQQPFHRFNERRRNISPSHLNSGGSNSGGGSAVYHDQHNHTGLPPSPEQHDGGAAQTGRVISSTHPTRGTNQQQTSSRSARLTGGLHASRLSNNNNNNVGGTASGTSSSSRGAPSASQQALLRLAMGGH